MLGINTQWSVFNIGHISGVFFRLDIGLDAELMNCDYCLWAKDLFHLGADDATMARGAASMLRLS